MNPSQLRMHRKLLAIDEPALRDALYGPKARWRAIIRARLRGTSFADRFLMVYYHGYPRAVCNAPHVIGRVAP